MRRRDTGHGVRAPAGFRGMNPDLPQPGPLYWTVQSTPRVLWRLFGRLRAEGVEHIPADGAFLMVSNHQSLLDPFLIQTVCPRPCHPMAKSTQFSSAISAWLMKRCYAFPVRRFQVDPQAVRVALRRLGQGEPVHIYVEGERTWDGSLRPPRPGTLRLALKAGVPILPVAIDGAYDIWPRWARGPRRGDVVVRFGEPFSLPILHRRADREAALPEAAERVMGAIAGLLGQPAPGLRGALDD